MNRKIIAVIVLGLVLFASLLACGYFTMKAIRTTRLRRAAMTAYDNKDYQQAESLLRQYVAKDPNAEAEFVALANIYHEFGNTGMEAQMWQTASALNPLNQEYHENMLTSAMASTSYSLLHNVLGRKARMNESLADRELYLYVISSCRTGYQKDASTVYQETVKANPKAFHISELGRLAEFMAKYPDLSEGERKDYLNTAVKSDDPMIRFEALYIAIRRAAQRNDDGTDYEGMLKQAVEVNYYAGTPILADFYFSENRFEDVIFVLEPYLKTIDDVNLYLLYAESCVFTGQLDRIRDLEKKLSRKSGALQLFAGYCDLLITYMENNEEKLVADVRQSSNLVNSPLFRFIRLRVAMTKESFSEIRALAQEIFSAPPFHDLQNRALIICLDYISNEMKKLENQKDPSQMAELAKILSGYLRNNQMLTEIILMDQYKKGLAKEADLLAGLEQFPGDSILQHVTAEYLILNGKSAQAMDIIKPVLAAATESGQEPDRGILFLYMLALDQLELREEASVIFQNLVEQSEFDLELLSKYFQFCVNNNRTADLMSMAVKLDTVKDGRLKHYGTFFRAAAMLLPEDEETEDEALAMLVSTPTDDPEFTFYAANRLCEYDRLDEAEAKYKAIQKTYCIPSLIHINLSNIYHAKGDEKKALEAAKEAFELEKKSMLPAFIYAQRLSEAERYQEAVDVLKFPRHAVNYREDVVALWCDCMRHVIEKSMVEERFSQAEEQCRHLLVIVPGDEFGKANLEKVREILKPKKDEAKNAEAEAADPAA